MNQFTQNALKVAVTGVLAGLSANAAAIIDFTGGTSSIAVYAKENPDSTTALSATGDTMTLKLPNLSNDYTVGGSNYYNIKVNLLNGAKFGANASPALYCDNGGGSGALALMGGPTVGGVGFSNATFVVPTATTLQGGSICHVSGISGTNAVALSGVATKQVSAMIEFKDGATPATTGYKSNLVTFATALKPVFTVAGSGVIDVAQQTLKYVDGSTTAYIGSVYYGSVTASAGAMPKDAADGNPVTGTKATVGGQTLATLDVTMTMTGSPLIGATKVTLNSDNTCATILASAAPSGQVVSFVRKVSAWQGSVAALGNSAHVCIQHDGTTVINAGKITASLDYSNETVQAQLQLPKSGQLREITKNGATFYGYVIPRSGGLDKTFFRFYNKSANAGNIRVTLYGQDGAMIGNQGVILVDSANFGPNQVAVVDVDAIQTAIGGSFASGRAHAVFDIELPDVEMVAAMRNTSDTTAPLINFSAEASRK